MLLEYHIPVYVAIFFWKFVTLVSLKVPSGILGRTVLHLGRQRDGDGVAHAGNGLRHQAHPVLGVQADLVADEGQGAEEAEEAAREGHASAEVHREPGGGAGGGETVEVLTCHSVR